MGWRKDIGDFVEGFTSIFRWGKAAAPTYDPELIIAEMWLHRAKSIVQDIIRMEHDPVWVEDAIDLRNYAENALNKRDYVAFKGAIRAIDTRMKQSLDRNASRFDELSKAFSEKAMALLQDARSTERTAREITRIAKSIRAELEKGVKEGTDPCIIMQIGIEQLEAL